MFAAPLFAEREGFEPSIEVTPYAGLANLCLQPLGHLSKSVVDVRRTLPNRASPIRTSGSGTKILKMDGRSNYKNSPRYSSRAVFKIGAMKALFLQVGIKIFFSDADSYPSFSAGNYHEEADDNDRRHQPDEQLPEAKEAC